jgi:hypothetical protein
MAKYRNGISAVLSHLPLLSGSYQKALIFVLARVLSDKKNGEQWVNTSIIYG